LKHGSHSKACTTFPGDFATLCRVVKGASAGVSVPVGGARLVEGPKLNFDSNDLLIWAIFAAVTLVAVGWFVGAPLFEAVDPSPIYIKLQ